jgi:hypothetical protein
MNKTHNLDIHMYSLQDLLGLFDIGYDISMEDIKRAKKKVLMTHPDKSKLDAKYFLFYKKAFEVVVQFYENQHKHTQSKQNTTQSVYEANQHSKNDESADKQVSSVLNKMSVNDFQSKFNKLFDENMTKKIDPTKNEWFTNNDETFQINEKVTNKNMGEVFNRIKDTQSSMVKYRGVENLYVNSGSGEKIYDDDNNDEYVSTDPFSKLKFDDLRKVHKDQTVFAVSERDINKVQQYSSVDHFMRERGKQSLSPLEKQEAERLLAQQDKTYRQRMMQKEYDAKMKTMQYEEKNKSVLSNFLRIKY